MNDNVNCLIDNVVDTALSSAGIRTICICVRSSEELFMTIGAVIERLKSHYLNPMPYWLEDDKEVELYSFEDGIMSFRVNIENPMKFKHIENRVYASGNKNCIDVCIFVSGEYIVHEIGDCETLFLNLSGVDFMQGSFITDEQ